MSAVAGGTAPQPTALVNPAAHIAAVSFYLAAAVLALFAMWAAALFAEIRIGIVLGALATACAAVGGFLAKIAHGQDLVSAIEDLTAQIQGGAAGGRP